MLMKVDIDHLPISSQQLLSWLNFQTPIEEVPFEGTCNWILQKPLFHQWYESPGSALLWVRGAPGMYKRSNITTMRAERSIGIGKTLLASYITTFLRAQSGVPVIHASCNSNTPNALHSIVRGMTGQLLIESPFGPEAAHAIFQLQVQYPNIADVPFNEILALLLTMLASSPGTTLILDGLDELDDETPELEQLLHFISRISQQTVAPVKVLLLSREVPFLQLRLASQPSLIIEPEDTIPGILRFVRARTELLKHLAPCSEMIQEVVVERSKGLFLWVEYFLSGLEGLRNINEIYDYLENTKDGLSSTYTDILQKLETGRTSLTSLRRRILTITAASFRTLTLPELEEILAVRKGICKIDDGDRVLGGWDTIHETCGPLLQYTNGKIDLLHLSAREFILSRTERIKFESLPRDSEEAHQYMAVICLTYLSFIELRPSFTGDPALDKERQLKYPLLEYATLHWADHMIKSGNLSPSSIDLLQLFITSLSAITWAVSYFPYFKLRDGESLFSAFGLMQTQISLVKISIRKSLTGNSTNQRSTLLKCLDVFLVQSFQNAISLEIDYLGPNHRDTLERQLDLSKVYQASRDLDQAYATANQTYTLATGILGTVDSLALQCKHQQLQVAMELELLKENPSFHQISLSFQALAAPLEKALGPHHKDTLRCNHDIGLVLAYEGKTQEGLRVLKVVLNQMREHLGRYALLTQRTANNVANALYTLGELDEAEVVLSSIPEVRKVSRPSPTIEIEACHPYTFDSLEILAITFCCKRDFERSITMHERAMKGRAALFGQDDPLLFQFAQNLGLVFERQRHYEKAAEHYKSWLYVAREHGMEVQMKQIQKALDDCLKTWAEEVERGALFRENNEEKILTKYTHWCRSSLGEEIVLVLGLLFSLLICYLLIRRFL
jgi:tetratricopeptide (TPR) repeat protein